MIAKMKLYQISAAIFILTILLLAGAFPVFAEGLEPVVKAGYYHSLALKTDGTVWAWGLNNYGQLGDNTLIPRDNPAPVPGLTGVTAIATNSSHNLALKSDGTVWAWGNNTNGQLGDNTTERRNHPVCVPNLTGVIAVDTGMGHSLAVKSDGTVWAWGSNYNGQLGDGTGVQSLVPVQVPGLDGILAVAAGDNFSMALKYDGTLWAWGSNNWGQLGDGNTTQKQLSPVQVAGFTGAIAIAAGTAHSLAIRHDGTVWAWGYNGYGQLGDGTQTPRSHPVQVQGLTGVAIITGGDCSSMAVKSDGTLWSWGRNNYGQLGAGTPDLFKKAPGRVKNTSNIVFASNSGSHALAVKADGSIRAWGRNNYGQLGVPVGENQTKPIFLASLNLGFTLKTQVAGGYQFSLALKSGGTLKSWGRNQCGQLGDNSYQPQQLYPVDVANLTDVVAISSGDLHSLALKTDGTVWAWGGGGCNQLGNGDDQDSRIPVQVTGLTDIIAIAAGSCFSMALKSDGTVWTWGANDFGQLGDGTDNPRNLAAQIPGLTQVVSISAGSYTSCAVKADGTVWAWGRGEMGQCGDGVCQMIRPNPVQANISDVTAVQMGSFHAIALKSDGTVWSWGYNAWGQLGIGSFYANPVLAPTQALNLTEIIAISSKNSHSLALKSDGTVWVWGDNSFGANDPSYYYHTPTQVSGLTDVTAVCDASLHCLAAKKDGTIMGWGKNDYGQAGDANPAPLRTAPVQVVHLNIGRITIPAVFAGYYHTAALAQNSRSWAWGWNHRGQLGDGSEMNQQQIPASVLNLDGLVEVSCGWYHTVALKADGTVWATGFNNSGQLGCGDTFPRNPAVQVLNLTDVISVKGETYYHSLALKSDGTVWAWGSNDWGQLGNPDLIISNTPVQVQGLSDIIQIAVGAYHNLALKSDGTVYAWGRNLNGELGLGDNTRRMAPVQILSLTNIKAISASSYHSFAVTADGNVYAWGYNGWGQLGLGNYTETNAPIQIPILTGVSKLETGYSHTLAQTTTGSFYTWGNNSFGEFGNGNFTCQPSPILCNEFTDVFDFGVGGFHTIMVKNDGTVWCWGYNEFGQLGNSIDDMTNLPVLTVNLNLRIRQL